MSITRTIPDLRTIQLAEGMRPSFEYQHGGTFPVWAPTLAAHNDKIPDEFSVHVRTEPHHSLDLQVKQDYPGDQFSVTYRGHQTH